MTNTIQTINATQFEEMKNAEKLRFIANVLATTEIEGTNVLANFLESQATSFDKKNAKRRSQPSKAQQESDGVREEVIKFFSNLEEGTILVGAEIMEVLGFDFSAQKTTAVLKVLVENGSLEKVEKVQVETQDEEGNVKKARKVGYKVA